jgi:hypothetical protein
MRAPAVWCVGKGEWRGLRPSLLVVDFDGTCTHADTTHVLAKVRHHRHVE